MTARTDAELKALFATGQQPNGQAFADLVDSIPGEAGVLTDADIPAAIARDAEVAAAVSAHAAASDPHGDRAYAAAQAAARKTLTDYQNIVVVDAGGNGDYTTLADALAAITDASATNPYGIVIMPGVYSESAPLPILEGVNVFAIVPGSVKLVLGAGAYLHSTDIYHAGGPTKWTNLHIQGSVNNLYLVYHTGELSVAFEDVMFEVLNSTSGVGIYDSGVLSNGVENVLLKRCTVIVPNGRTAINCAKSAGKFTLEDSTVVINGASGFCIQISASNVVAAHHSRFIGGTNSFKAGTAKTAIIALCELQKAMSNVTSIITTPYNVIDEALSF